MAFSSLAERLKKGLAKTARLLDVRKWFNRKVDQAFLEELEKSLIQADVGVGATAAIISRAREAFGDKTVGFSIMLGAIMYELFQFSQLGIVGKFGGGASQQIQGARVIARLQAGFDLLHESGFGFGAGLLVDRQSAFIV